MENSWCACGLLSFGFGWLLASLASRALLFALCRATAFGYMFARVYIGERALVSVCTQS